MGKVIEKVKEFVNLGNEIACVISCDALIVGGVSNWCGEAIAVALAAEHKINNNNHKNWEHILCDLNTHKQIYLNTSKYGAACGMTNNFDGWVDSFDYQTHQKFYQSLCDIVQKLDTTKK